MHYSKKAGQQDNRCRRLTTHSTTSNIHIHKKVSLATQTENKLYRVKLFLLYCEQTLFTSCLTQVSVKLSQVSRRFTELGLHLCHTVAHAAKDKIRQNKIPQQKRPKQST